MSYPAYTEYEESGEPWIGPKPAHWKIMKLHHVVRMKSGSSITSLEMTEVGEYPVFGGNGVRGRFSDFTHEGSYVLIGRQGAECGNINYAHGKFWASEHAVVAKPDRELEYRWLGETLRAMNLNQYSQSAAQPGLSVEAVGRLKLPFPPVVEQKQIADFLDWKTRQIDALIAKKKQLIEKLQEQRIAVITQAVTKGLNPDAPMRDSGIPWVGEVPEHWEVKKLGYATESRCDGPFGSGLKSEHYTDDGVRVVRLQNIEFAEFDDEDKAFIDSDHYQTLGNHDVRPGDLLVAGLGDTNNPVGRACRAPDLGAAMVKADCFRYRLESDKGDSQFMAYQMSVTAKALAGALAAGVTRSRMNLSLTSARVLAFPPVDEQIEIAEYLDGRIENFDSIESVASKAIDRLTEYRTALITAATTDKIDVRGLKIPN